MRKFIILIILRFACAGTRECSDKCSDYDLSSGLANCSNKTLCGFICSRNDYLISLDLSGNKLKSIPKCIFEEYKNLTWLNMSRNRFLGYNTPLLKVDDSNNLLTLDMSNCEIIDITLNGLVNLKHIDLSGNRLKKINGDFFKGNIKLQHVNLANNYITELDITSFAPLKELLYLDLAFNKLIHLEANLFATNKQLYSLNLSNNHFKLFPRINSSSLRYIKMQQCALTGIDKKAFETLLSIDTLDLSNNQLDMIFIPKLMFSNTLSHLDLSSNRIKDLHLTVFRNFKSLTSLNLANNKLTSMKLINFLQQNENLKYLNVTDNPWICDCDYINYNYLEEKVSEDLRCINPQNQIEEKWTRACDSQITQSSGWVPFEYIIYGLIIVLIVYLILKKLMLN